MRRKRYDKGGLTEADIAAGLTQADIDAGLRAGRNERISDEDRQAALRNARAAESFAVAESKPKMRQGLTDLEAATLMGRPVRQEAPRRVMPNKNVASPHDFEPPMPAFEDNFPNRSRFYNEAFEDNYPGPRQVKVPTRKSFGSIPEVGVLDTSTNRPYSNETSANFLKRLSRAELNAPLSRDMIDNPAKARLMRAIAAASNQKYDQDARDAALIAQQLRSDFDTYKKGGVVKKKAKGGSVKSSSASRRGDGIAQRGKTKGRMI